MNISRFITSLVVLSAQELGSLAFECSNNTQLTEMSNPVFSAFGALTCSWIITVSDIYVIQLTVKTHDIDSVGNVNCATDYLQIRDGRNSSSRLLGTVCNTNPSSSEFRSSGNQLWVEYKSTSNQKEFEASFQRVLQHRYVICNETSVMVFSPFFPADFPNDMDCTWNLTGPPGSRIIFTFRWICLGICTTPSSSCDTLEVNNVYLPKILSLGSDLGASVSLQNVVTLSFHTDGQHTSKGFMAKCEAVFRETACSRMVHLNNSSGWFSSPNFPLGYPAGMECSWNISVPSGYKLLLTFLAFDIEQCTSSCACDYVEVRFKPYTQAYAVKKCGTQGEREWNVKSLSNLLVTFKSDSRGNKKGFEAAYILRPLDAYDTVPSAYCPLTHSTTAESPVTEESHTDIDKPLTAIAQTAAPSDKPPNGLSPSSDSPTTRGNSANRISVSSIVTLLTKGAWVLLFYCNVHY